MRRKPHWIIESLETRKIYSNLHTRLQTREDAHWPYSCALQTILFDVQSTNFCCSNPTGLLILTVFRKSFFFIFYLPVLTASRVLTITLQDIASILFSRKYSSVLGYGAKTVVPKVQLSSSHFNCSHFDYHFIFYSVRSKQMLYVLFRY